MIEDQAEVASDVARAVRQTWPWAALLGVLAAGTVLLETTMGILMLAGGSFLPPEAFSYALPRYGDARGVFVEMLKTPDCGQF